MKRIYPYLILLFLLTACNGTTAEEAAQQQTRVFQDALLTATYGIVNNTTATPEVTFTPTPEPSPTPTIVRTPPDLPAQYTTGLLNPVDQPVSYIQDTCTYLLNKWDPNKSSPGTVVMPIMFHSITKGAVTEANQISVDQFQQLVKDLKDQGFIAISMTQFVDFMENNAKIPERSALLIVDDRKRSEYFEDHFRNLYDDYGWVVVNAWISAPDTPDYLWQENEWLEAQGYVDHQAHGVIHNINMTADASDDFIKNELFGSISAIQDHFGKKPSAIIWPGGVFTKRSVEIAREAGYKVGFTINPRGPVMYNWVPQSDASDPQRPSYLPEISAGDPLMTLPRYWDTDASIHIDTVRQLGNEAAQYAQANKAVELEYYDIVCAPTYGNIPEKQP
jgi:hypothetical protein